MSTKLLKSLCIVVVAALILSLAPVGISADSGASHQLIQDRPIELGTSGGNINDRSLRYCCSGTLGSLVQDSGGKQYILSNNHVLARLNQAEIGEPVSQPGQIDQQCGQTGLVADLSNFVPIKISKGRSVKTNQVDAAIAQVRPDAVQADGSIIDIGALSDNTVAAFVTQNVQKSGRTTGRTNGTVAAINVTVDVGYSKECGGAANQVARFVNQIRISDGTFSGAGDSGSLVVEGGTADPDNGLPRAVGLLFAGSANSTLANPIDAVLSALSVSMVGGVPVPPGPTGSVSGTVTAEADSSPIAGATVTADTGQSTATDANGDYSLTDVPVGDRTVTATASGFAADSQPATVTEDVDTSLSFVLSAVSEPTQSKVECVSYNTEGGKNADKHLLITIQVADDFATALAGAQVAIAVTSDGQPFGTGSGTTNSQGTVTFSAKNARDATYETTVTSITAGSLVFDGSTPANSFTKGTDSVPADFCVTGSSLAATSSPAAASPLHSFNAARNAQAQHSKALWAISGVVGHGIGLSKTGQPVIEVYLAQENAAARTSIPASLDSVPVRVIVTGPFEAF